MTDKIEFRRMPGKTATGSLLLFILFILLSCNDNKYQSIFPDPESTPENWLVDTTDLGIVPVSFIRLTASLAGYPQFNDYMRYSIQLYKISYWTQYKGEYILASGLISYPVVDSTASIPLLMAGNGLIFSNEEAPSAFNLPENYTGFEFIASLGYFTLIPDMIGFGASKELLFPVQNYEHSARAMVHMYWAAEELLEGLPCSVNPNTFLTGYSQGGYIALATLKMIEENPDWGITVNATAVGAGGFNLTYLLKHLIENNTYSAPSHLALLLSSYNIMYNWKRPLSDFFQQPYAGKIPELLNGTYTRVEIDRQLAYSFDSLLNPYFLKNIKRNMETELTEALEINSVNDWAPSSNLRIIHSIYDERIPVFDSEETYRKMVAGGAENVSFTKLESEGHLNSGFEFINIVLLWFNELNANEY